MVGCVAIAADERRSGQGQTGLGSDEMHDPLFIAVPRNIRNAEIAHIVLKRLNLQTACLVGNGSHPASAVVRRNIMISNSDGAARIADTTVRRPQPLERLRTGHFVHQVPVDVEQDRPVVELGHDMRSEEHTSELQSLMRNSYAVFCLKKTK